MLQQKGKTNYDNGKGVDEDGDVDGVLDQAQPFTGQLA